MTTPKPPLAGKAPNYHLRGWAARKIGLAIKTGIVQRGAACEECGVPSNGGRKWEANVVAHHPDYAEPLAVRWLCRRCHTHAHMALARAGVHGELICTADPRRGPHVKRTGGQRGGAEGHEWNTTAPQHS